MKLKFKVQPYQTNAEISKERIRRAGRKIKEELTTKHLNDTKKDEKEDLFGEADQENVRDFRVFRGSKNEFEVFFVDDSALITCFDTGVNEELVKELAGFEPLRVIFRDNVFVSDAIKINVEQIFKQMSPGTEVKAI